MVGWRRELLPRLPEEAFFRLAPDWTCDVLSPSTAAHDREKKMAVYAREGVRHVWVIDQLVRTLEVFALGEGGRWAAAGEHRGDAHVRVEPFEALELELATLWAERSPAPWPAPIAPPSAATGSPSGCSRPASSAASSPGAPLGVRACLAIGAGRAGFLAERGLALAEDVGAADYRARHFGSAAARMRGTSSTGSPWPAAQARAERRPRGYRASSSRLSIPDRSATVAGLTDLGVGLRANYRSGSR